MLELTNVEINIITEIRKRNANECSAKRRILHGLIPKIGKINNQLAIINNKSASAEKCKLATECLSALCCHVQPNKSSIRNDEECNLWLMQCPLCQTEMYIHLRDEIGTDVVACDIAYRVPFPTLVELMTLLESRTLPYDANIDTADDVDDM